MRAKPATAGRIQCAVAAQQPALHSQWLSGTSVWPDRSMRKAGPGRAAKPIINLI